MELHDPFDLDQCVDPVWQKTMSCGLHPTHLAPVEQRTLWSPLSKNPQALPTPTCPYPLLSPLEEPSGAAHAHTPAPHVAAPHAHIA